MAPRRSMGAERMEDVLGDWTKSPETSNKGPWLNWRDRKDFTTSTRSDGPSKGPNKMKTVGSRR